MKNRSTKKEPLSEKLEKREFSIPKKKHPMKPIKPKRED